MLKFIKAMAAVIKDEVPEVPDCGCRPKKNKVQASTCCGPMKDDTGGGGSGAGCACGSPAAGGSREK